VGLLVAQVQLLRRGAQAWSLVVGRRIRLPALPELRISRTRLRYASVFLKHCSEPMLFLSCFFPVSIFTGVNVQ
jgi:hypothetical protein